MAPADQRSDLLYTFFQRDNSMTDLYFRFLLFAQDAAPAAGKGAEDGGAAGGGIFGGFEFFIPVVGALVLFYFLMMRPEQKKRAELQDLLKNLKKNQHVETVGGIHGVVANVQDRYVTVRIDDATNTRIKVLRSAIARVVTAEDMKTSEEKEEEGKGK